MIQRGDLVAVAVSGGKDSLTLLDVMHKISDRHNFDIRVITIDEGIPGYREEALDLVAKFCNKLDIEYNVYSYKDLFDVTLSESLEIRDDRMSSCSICGTLRRRAMDFAARDLGASAIATGHNLDDTLQTFVINMLSGDTNRIGWTGPNVAAIPPRKIKPFCEIYESEIVFYAFTNNIPFQTEPCPHMNEGIRTEIREFLNSLETQHSGIKNNLYQSITKVSEIVKTASHKQRGTCTRCGNDCTGEICSACSMLLKLKTGSNS